MMENQGRILRLLNERVLKHSLVRFTIVGGIGFLIEAMLLTYFATVPSVGPIWGRFISFPLAVLATWWLNRTLTFKSTNDPGREGMRYFLVQIFGALANLAVFISLVSHFPSLQGIPVVPLFMAAIVGLIVNFVLSKKFVFITYGKQ